MSELDAQTILNLSAVLAHNLATATIRRHGLPDLGGAQTALYEQQIIRAFTHVWVQWLSSLNAR